MIAKMIANRPSADLLERPEPTVDRSMLVLQYLMAAIAFLAAVLLAVAS